MIKYVKAKKVNLLVDGAAIQSSTSCTLALTANTADAASKTDPGDGMWDNPAFVSYSWTMGNESFVADIEALSSLLLKVINGDATLDVAIQDENNFYLEGSAIVTQLQLNAPNGDNATMSLSLEGLGPLNLLGSNVHDVVLQKTTPIKGRALMLALKLEGTSYRTIAGSTGHSLTVSLQTADVNTKDTYDMSVYKEVTGKSISLSTENLIAMSPGDGVGVYGLMDVLMQGMPVEMSFGYYQDTSGAEAPEQNWGEPSRLLVNGTFLVSSLSVNASNKDNATYSAEFSGQGAPTVTGPSPANEEGGE